LTRRGRSIGQETKIEIRKSKLENRESLSIFEFRVSSFEFRFSSFDFFRSLPVHRPRALSFFLSIIMQIWPEAPGDDFGEVNYLEVVTLGVVGGVAKHDGTVGASNHHGRCLGFGELGKAEFVDSLFGVIPLVVREEKPRPARSAALRVLAMVRSFRE
jgi:hypothetical protein